jgi:16S rRNA (uracil1498-N3)-methyltransferase
MARRLYCEAISTGKVILTGPEAHHGRDVLRLRIGDEVELFDGRGGYASAKVAAVGRSELQFQVEGVGRNEVERPIMTLATAMPKFAHQETLVKMCTEIGVSDFSPVIYEYSAVREQFREEKWQRWSLEACKQCGMNALPEVHPAAKLAEFLKTLNGNELLIIGSTLPSDRRLDGVGNTDRVVIFIGPEGGFTEAETESLPLLR